MTDKAAKPASDDPPEAALVPDPGVLGLVLALADRLFVELDGPGVTTGLTLGQAELEAGPYGSRITGGQGVKDGPKLGDMLGLALGARVGILLERGELDERGLVGRLLGVGLVVGLALGRAVGGACGVGLGVGGGVASAGTCQLVEALASVGLLSAPITKPET